MGDFSHCLSKTLWKVEPKRGLPCGPSAASRRLRPMMPPWLTPAPRAEPMAPPCSSSERPMWERPGIWRGSATGRCRLGFRKVRARCVRARRTEQSVQNPGQASRLSGSRRRCGDSRSARRVRPCRGPSGGKYELNSRRGSQLSPPQLCLVVLPDGALPATCLGMKLGNDDGRLCERGDSCCLHGGANRSLIW